MYEQVLTIFSVSEILSSVSSNLDVLANVVDGYLSGANNLRIASIILMLLAFILFLFLVIILYVKSIISFLKSDKSAHVDGNEDIFDDEDAARLNQIMEEQERERELEKELQKELEMARAEKEMLETQQRLELENREHEKKTQLEQEGRSKQRQKDLDEAKKTIKEAEAKNPMVDLDWKKGRLQEAEIVAASISNELMSYKQSKKDLGELMGLVIDMIGRGVDDLKIAQTVMFRNQGNNTEDDILQMIDSVKDFITLCVEQSFTRLPDYEKLPHEDVALFHLANGDPTPALALLENLMDYNIDRSQVVEIEARKNDLYQEISQQASIFGSLSAINDVHLATGAFELSIELYPNNINSWSRLGDMYARAESNNKAIWAYQNVIKQADEDVYARQVANANKMLSQHLYAQGNSLQAAKLYNSSKQYYDTLGINRRLDKQEVEIIEIIEAHQQDEMQSTIAKILNREVSNVYNF